MIVIVDYGMGNLRSVSKALESLGADVQVSSDPADVARADKLLLPGVGAFGAAMEELTRRRLIEPIKSALASGRPYLGICLGLQLLFESSEESPNIKGLGILPGIVKRFSFNSALRTPNAALKIPHMGWNQVRPQSPPQRMADPPRRLAGTVSATTHGGPATPSGGHSPQATCPLLKGIPEGSFFYFVHSYCAEPSDRSVVALEADYGGPFASMVWRGNLYATQFHPEKSQALGLQLLKNFIAL